VNKYDALYRLIKATGRELSSLQLPTHSDFANNIPVPNMGDNAMQNYTQQFTYDELGNIIQMKSVGQWTRDYYYDILHNNYLTGHTPRTIDYTYDEHGNMLTMPHLQSMHYDYQDQLNKVVLDASENTAYYIYDANGQRVRKVIEKTGGIKEERYYLGNYEVYRKFVGITLETERTTVAVADDKRKIATIDKLTVDERSLINLPVVVIRYQYDNHLGSASLELDATAQIISYEEYHPFGSTSYRSGRSETEVSLKRYKYVGKERDEETGLYYYGFRYYAPWIARFINVDPLQHEYPQLTPFQYASNNPVTLIDLDGLEGVAKDFNFMPEAEPFRKDTPNTQRSSLSHNIQLYEIQQVNGDEIISGETIGSEIHRLRGDGFDYYLTPIVDKNKSIIGYNVFTEEYRIDYVISSKDLPAFIQNRTLFRNAADLFNMNKSEDMVRLAAASSKQDIDAAMGALGALWAANWKQALIEGVFNFAMGYASGSATSRNARPKPNVGGGAAKTGMAEVRALGAAGEEAVGITGSKTAINVGGRTRFPDRLTTNFIEEVKNVKHQSLTRQLRDFYQYSQDNGLQMILHTRPTTTFSGPLNELINNGSIIR